MNEGEEKEQKVGKMLGNIGIFVKINFLSYRKYNLKLTRNSPNDERLKRQTLNSKKLMVSHHPLRFGLLHSSFSL